MCILNRLNAELNPICHLLALLAHHILHISGIRVKELYETLKEAVTTEKWHAVMFK